MSARRHAGADGPKFQPEISELDLVSLPKYQIYLRLMVNGVPSRT